LDYRTFVAASNTDLGALLDGDASTFNSRWGDQMVWLDFGAKYRVIPQALHIQVRQGFPDRVRGGHLLASDDNVNWVQITDKSGYGEQMQRLPVHAEYRNHAYRYLKIYAAPSDCNCPVFDLGELYLFGQRKEVNEIVKAPPRWLVGEPLSLQVATSDPQGNAIALTAEVPPGARFDAATGRLTWTPAASQTGTQTLTIAADYGYTTVVMPLVVKVSTSANAAIDEILAELGSTDGYTEFSVGTLTSAVADARAVAGNAYFGVLRKLDYVSLVEKAVASLEPYFGKIDTAGNATILASHQRWNTPSQGPTLSGLSAFDGNVATFVDLQNGNGTWVQADFGADRHVRITQVRLTPRSGFALRLNGAWITASNDGAAWTTIATLASDAYTSNATTTASALTVSNTIPYRYLRFNGADSSFGNVAEIEYVGSTDFGFDRTTLQYLIAKAGILKQAEYTEETWTAMSAALASATSVAASVPLNAAAVAEATETLDTALNELVPLKGSVRIQVGGIANEAGGTVTFRVTRSGGGFGKAWVRYRTTNGSAKAGEDYQALAGLLNWDDGEQGDKTVSVALVNDAFYEDSEQFTAELSDPYGTELGAPVSASITIVDDDVNALPGLSVSNASMAEGTWLATVLGPNRMKFDVTLSGTPKNRVTAVLVSADGSAKAALDYFPYVGVVSFAPGETTKTVEVLIVPDRLREADETMKLKALGIVNARPRQPTGTGTIVNDD
jgi:hypothetical protein